MLLDLIVGIRYDKRTQLQNGKLLSLPDELLCRVFDVMTDLDDIMALAITNSRLLQNAERRIHSVYGSQKDRRHHKENRDHKNRTSETER